MNGFHTAFMYRGAGSLRLPMMLIIFAYASFRSSIVEKSGAASVACSQCIVINFIALHDGNPMIGDPSAAAI